MNKESIDFIKKCPALTGSIATGKSTVARMFAALGGHIVDTDLIAREVVEPGHRGLDEVRKAFGDGVINADGRLDREALRGIIINDSGKRKLLDSILHPLINDRVFQILEMHRKNDDGKPVIIDVPLLYETGWDRLFGQVIVVYVPREVQIERLIKRDGIERAVAEATVATQMSVEEKKDRAHFVVDNSASLPETEKQATGIFEKLLKEWQNPTR